MIFHSLDSCIADLAQQPEGRDVLERYLPGLLDNEFVRTNPGLRLATIAALSPALRDRAVLDALVAELGTIEVVDLTEPEEPWPARPAEVEGDDVVRGSAPVTLPAAAATYATVELTFAGPEQCNPFMSVALTATLRQPAGDELALFGFYDGEGTYRIRFLPEELGPYTLTTTSNARSLDAIEVTIDVGQAEPGDHGPVRVKGLGFAHADGTRAIPLGTTCYAWTHQTTELQEQTLATLADGPFTKLRMCVFPKSMPFNSNEPELYPYALTTDATGPGAPYDTQTFNPAFFQHLEQRIAQLGKLGIDADVILFHPYDRWGYATLGRQADEHYLRYVVARLAAFPNVWWSLANEYDAVPRKNLDDWNRLGRLVRELDPYDHPTGIHQMVTFFDNSVDWVTHSSMQKVDTYRTAENTDDWLRQWGKPVVVDEMVYEGDIEYGWGNITGEELVRRFWETSFRGGYGGHGETYMDPDDVLWWAKGGVLKGTSAPRIAFLRELLESLPGNPTYVADWTGPVCQVVDDTGTPTDVLAYTSFMQPRLLTLRLPEGSWQVTTLDTWEMTTTPVPGTFTESATVELPGRPYQAVHAQRIS